jgi:hypothetical protein
MIVIIYIDNILIYCKDEEEIEDFIKEGTAEGYLGVDIKQEDGNIILTQSGLTKQNIKGLMTRLQNEH